MDLFYSKAMAHHFSTKGPRMSLTVSSTHQYSKSKTRRDLLLSIAITYAFVIPGPGVSFGTPAAWERLVVPVQVSAARTYVSVSNFLPILSFQFARVVVDAVHPFPPLHLRPPGAPGERRPSGGSKLNGAA